MGTSPSGRDRLSIIYGAAASPCPASQMRRFIDTTGDRSDWQWAKGLVFEPFSMKVLSAGGIFRILFVGGKAAQPFTNLHGVSLSETDAGSGMWNLTMSPAPIMSFGRSGEGATDAESLAAAITMVDWNGSPSPVFLYPSWHEFPAINTARLPAFMFQVSNYLKRSIQSSNKNAKYGMSVIALQMTVSAPEREFEEMEDKLEGLLAVMPESEQYFLIICTDREFKLVGQRRLSALAGKSTRMSRLSIFHMNMRTACEEAGDVVAKGPGPARPKPVPRPRKNRARGAEGTVALDPEPAEPPSVPKARRRRSTSGAGAILALDPQPIQTTATMASDTGRSHKATSIEPDPSHPPQPRGASIGRASCCAPLLPRCKRLPDAARRHFVLSHRPNQRLFRV